MNKLCVLLHSRNQVMICHFIIDNIERGLMYYGINVFEHNDQSSAQKWWLFRIIVMEIRAIKCTANVAPFVMHFISYVVMSDMICVIKMCNHLQLVNENDYLSLVACSYRKKCYMLFLKEIDVACTIWNNMRWYSSQNLLWTKVLYLKYYERKYCIWNIMYEKLAFVH